MEPAEILETLRQCEVLATDDDAALSRLAERARVASYQTDQIVFAAGETSSDVFVVASGSCQILLGGSAKLISYAEAGILFGEYAMFAKGVRTAHAVATQPTVLVAFDADAFREYMLRCPEVALRLLQTTVRRLHRIARQRA